VRKLVSYMTEDPRTISIGLDYLFIAKAIERIGDHATNIAETVHYAATGTPLADERPRGSGDGAYAVVRPRDND
jgi:phosphate transport system protein